LLIVLKIAVAGSGGALARVAYISARAAAAVQWTHAGMLYALAEPAHVARAGAGTPMVSGERSWSYTDGERSWSPPTADKPSPY
jgi:hypothetical protein